MLLGAKHAVRLSPDASAALRAPRSLTTAVSVKRYASIIAVRAVTAVTPVAAIAVIAEWVIAATPVVTAR